MRIVKIINFNNNLCSIIKKSDNRIFDIFTIYKKNYMSKYLVFNILNIR